MRGMDRQRRPESAEFSPAGIGRNPHPSLALNPSGNGNFLRLPWVVLFCNTSHLEKEEKNYGNKIKVRTAATAFL